MTENQPMYMQWLLWSFLFILAFLAVYLLLTLLFSPLLFLYNKLTDKNKNNVLKEDDFLMGELVTRIVGDSVGEVLEIGSGTALSSYPAKLYRKEDREKDILLPKGTQVLIIEFDAQGIALVVQREDL
ncbi:hypothetical protein IV487_12755 [Enterococcus saccharolyticus]|nr:hypothetical protein [Enterococcus saccharolyticus]